jgi:hypothetical protein
MYFEKNFYDSKRAGLTLACWEMHKDKADWPRNNRVHNQGENKMKSATSVVDPIEEIKKEIHTIKDLVKTGDHEAAGGAREELYAWTLKHVSEAGYHFPAKIEEITKEALKAKKIKINW